MHGNLVLYVDQYGERIYAKTVRELYTKAGYSRASRIYRDTTEGVVHVGYVVGPHWFEAFIPYRKKV